MEKSKPGGLSQAPQDHDRVDRRRQELAESLALFIVRRYRRSKSSAGAANEPAKPSVSARSKT